MAFNRISREKILKKIEYFRRHHIPFIKKTTTERTTLFAGRYGNWQNKESSFNPKELQFIKMVKAYIIKHETYKLIRNNFKKEGSNKKIKYFFYNKNLKPGDYFEDLVEIDLTSAYWYTAYNKLKGELFSEEIFLRGIEKDPVTKKTIVSKKSRLAAIGSLAKTTSIIEYDGKNEHALPPERSKETEFLWNTICHHVGKVMAKGSSIAKEDFIFFWVDAMFVKKESASRIKKHFKAAGYACTTHKCEWVRFEENRIIVKSTEKGKWVKKRKEVEFKRDGKIWIRYEPTKHWVDERPFPYKHSMTEADIINLSNQAQ